MRCSTGLFACVVVCAGFGATCRAQVLDPMDFDRLLDEMDSQVFREREKAQETLTGAAERVGGLSTAQVAKLQVLSLSGFKSKPPVSLELARRSTQVFAAFVKKFPSASVIISQLAIRADATTGAFTFGPLTGKYDPKDAASRQAFLTLQRHWKAIALGLQKGDVPQVYDGYDALFVAMKQLDDAGLKKLNLKMGNKDFTYADFVDLNLKVLEPALGKLPGDYKNAGADANPGPKDDMAVAQAGPVPAGLSSIHLDIGQVLSGGALDIVSPPADLALSVPPKGFATVGHLFDITATDGLDVAGRVRIDIEYGDLQLIGNPVIDPSRLQIVRYADGLTTPLTLDRDHTDPGHFILSAYYDLRTDPGADQFGEFAIIQAVPEPGVLTLLGTGALALLLHARHRGRRMPPPAPGVAS